MASTEATRPALTNGDPFPELVLPDGAGGRIDFTHQTLAGNTLVLCLARHGLNAGQAAELETMVDSFADVGARVFVISVKLPDEDHESSHPVALDPDWRLAATLSLGDAGIMVGDPRGRIRHVEEGLNFAAAQHVANAIAAASEALTVRGGAPALIVPEVLEIGLCTALIDYWTGEDKQDDLVASGKGAQDASDVIKRRSDVLIRDKELFERVKDRIVQRLLPEIRKSYCFNVASFEALRVGCYDANRGGFFKRHRDNATRYTAHRSFAMSLNLNTGDYQGGQVRFPEFGNELYEAGPGGAVIFSCNLLHEAMPVTAGKRFAVFTFFADAAGKERERQMMEEQKKMGRKGVALG